MSDSQPSSLAPGDSFGHYQIVERLGHGGMGEVFLAYDSKLERRIAVKVLSPELVSHADWFSRFLREARSVAALNHPNIVTIYSVEEGRGQHLLMMELVEGTTLRRILPTHGFSFSQFFGIAVGLTNALSAAHERGVAHRDLKPENVMITPSGWVKVLDFGLAKRTPVETSLTSFDTTLTVAGHVVGTVSYMSPEQAAGLSVDHRSDIFSLGVMFYEMLSGVRPFSGETASQVIASILRDTPQPLETRRTDLPVGLARAVETCLCKDRAGRFESVRELQSVLRDVGRQVDAQALQPMSSTSFADTRGSRLRLTAVLAGVFLLNWIETTVEGAVRTEVVSGLGYDMARAFAWLEGGLSFERHDLTNAAAVFGGSFSYFVLPILMLTALVITLWRRPAIDGYRVLVLAFVVTYAISFLFFVFLPVPERWAFPASNAILLSDLWSTRLIELLRPFSGLDNCFPSFHVAATVDMVLVGLIYKVRFRHALGLLGAAVITSTYLLGIHWLADIGAGLALGAISVRVAGVLNERFSGPV